MSPYDVTTDFEPVGIGKPLTIEIRHIYTGQYPKTRSFGRGGQRRNQGMLVTSAMKSIATFDAAPRAVNFLTKNVTGGKNLSNPSLQKRGLL